MPTLKLSDDDLELITAALGEQIRVIGRGAWPTRGFDPKKYGGKPHNTAERIAGKLRELKVRVGMAIGVVDMPDAEHDAITADEAVRRRSIAEMIIAEVQAAKAFRKSAGLDPEGTLQVSMHPPAEIAAYLEMKVSDVDPDPKRVQIDIGDQVRSGLFSQTDADEIAAHLGGLNRLAIAKRPKGRKKLIEDNLPNHLLSFFRSDDGQSTSFLPDWGAIRDLPLDVRGTMADTIESICRTIRDDIREDWERPRSARS